MARTVRDADLGTREGREKLAPRKKPYYRLIDPGCHLGYYKGARGGAWLARRLLGDERYETTTLGTADDTRDASDDRRNGTKDGSVLSFAQAQAKARAWFAERARAELSGGDAADATYTVADAMADYLLDYKRRGGRAPADFQRRSDRIIVPAFGKVRLAQLTKRQIRAWHAGMAERGAQLRTPKGAPPKRRAFDPKDEEAVRKRRATANRTLSMLKAALNFAYAEDKVATDVAWRTVKPFRQVDVARIRYLDEGECRRLVNASDAGFRPMVQAALLTGCRYGELMRLQVQDFDARAGTLTVARSKGGKPRHVVLNDDGTTFFTQVATGRAHDERMLLRPDGAPWGYNHQIRQMVDACKAAKISPAVSFHILRHTYASLLVMRGVPLQIAAANLGHVDTRMTEKHYAHLAPSHIADVIRAAMPKLGIVKRTNVVALG